MTSKRARDAGMVTAEIAVAMPVLMVLLAVGLTAVAVIAAQMRCVDAAREAARALARGESISAARSLADAAGPHGATLASNTEGDLVRTSVRATVSSIGGLFPAFTVHADAVALREPAGSTP
jgi:Flp pilus assembly protein TadG